MRSCCAVGFLWISLFAQAWAQPVAKRFIGSRECAKCHAGVYERWKKTRMANILQDAKAHPEVILGDFSKPDPAVTFRKEDILFTYGSKWKQRYFVKAGDDYYVLPAQWDVRHATWRPYAVKAGADWWVPHYPADPMQRPTGPLCDGCHSVNYNVRTKQVTEWNVGCEKCHGPGSAHAARPSRDNIVNPGRLDFVRANDVCIQCHSQGRPKTNPIAGRYFDWPVGFLPGERLDRVWDLEEHRLGETTFTHYPDGTAHKNRSASPATTCTAPGTQRTWCARATNSASNATGRSRPTDRGDHSARTRTTRRGAPGASASPATCRKSSRPSGT